MRELDRTAIEEIGIPGVVLMENAGAGVAREIVRRLDGRVAGVPVGIVCGAGGNGGDGFVIARHLANQGATVRIYLLAARERIRGDARINLDIADKMGLVFARSLDPLA